MACLASQANASSSLTPLSPDDGLHLGAAPLSITTKHYNNIRLNRAICPVTANMCAEREREIHCRTGPKAGSCPTAVAA